MLKSMSQNNKAAWLLLKVALMLLSFYFIFFHIKQEDVLKHLLILKKEYLVDADTRIYILSVVGLMFLNWICEAFKWQYLTSFYFRQSLPVALRAVLTGLAVSIFTPNRSGDFAGRIMHLPSGLRVEGAVFSFVGSITQVLITITAGFISLLFLIEDLFDFSRSSVIVGALFVFFIIACLHYFLFNFNKYWHVIADNKWLRKLAARVVDVGELTPGFIFKIYILSLLRYLIFSFQFCLLLNTFDVHLSFSLILNLVMISFLFITVIPSFALSEIGIRGSICIFFFSKFTSETSGVLLASTLLWLINIAAPAVVGAFGMLYFKRAK